jgi:hypothetical protein
MRPLCYLPIELIGGQNIPIEEDQVQVMFHTMFDRYGSIDILVNNMDAHKDAAFTALTLAAWARPEGEAEPPGTDPLWPA